MIGIKQIMFNFKSTSPPSKDVKVEVVEEEFIMGSQDTSFFPSVYDSLAPFSELDKFVTSTLEVEDVARGVE